MFHRLPQTMQALDDMPDSFRTGIGHDYDSHGPEGAVGIERSFEPWNQHNLLRKVLPAMDGVVERLEAGARVADVGCGAGGAVMLMAEAFPNSTFVGYDISRHALDRAEQQTGRGGLSNARFVDPRDEPLPTTASLRSGDDVRLHPRHGPPDSGVARSATRFATTDTGCSSTSAPRDARREHRSQPDGAAAVRRQRAGVHVVGALSEPDGEGLGTLGLPASKAEAMATAAGFGRFQDAGRRRIR